MKKLAIIFCAVIFIAAAKDELHKGFDLKTFEKSLAFIPKGSFMFYDSVGGPEVGELEHKGAHKVRARTVSVDSFFMCNHEVSNAEYKEFLADLESNNRDLYAKMLPDTLVWRDKLSYNEPYVKYYFRHPAYSDYPVVGITHDQADAYCKWLTDKYMSQEKRKYKKVRFELPSLYQWEYAAIGAGYGIFPWTSGNMINTKGQVLANFSRVGQGSIKREKVYIKDSAGNYQERYAVVSDMYSSAEPDCMPDYADAADVTCPVFSYWPNGYGLYNMAGNVSEYVKEDGITKGGSWKDYGYYLQNWVEQSYNTTHKASNDRGFRYIMVVEEMWPNAHWVNPYKDKKKVTCDHCGHSDSF